VHVELGSATSSAVDSKARFQFILVIIFRTLIVKSLLVSHQQSVFEVGRENNAHRNKKSFPSTIIDKRHKLYATRRSKKKQMGSVGQASLT
jgi:hypothetical protein